LGCRYTSRLGSSPKKFPRIFFIEGDRGSQDAHQIPNSDLDARLGSKVHNLLVVPPHVLLNGSIGRAYPPRISNLIPAHTSQTGGYDGSMMNGLNILPSYTDYFVLTPATTGLNTASIFIGGFFGPLVSGIISDRLGRRPAIFWGSVITLVGVLLQTAAQDIAMFVVARIVLGFGAALSGIAGGVYLSETFPSQWRAWGVGMLNNFY
jgi:hypothetical protein